MTPTMRRAVTTTWVVVLLLSALIVGGILIWEQQRQQACVDQGWQPIAGQPRLCVDSDGTVRSPR